MNEAELLVRDGHVVIVGVVRHADGNADAGSTEDAASPGAVGESREVTDARSVRVAGAADDAGEVTVTVIAEGRGDADDPEHPGGTDALRLDELVGAELADALDEWARVCAALRRSGGGAGRAVVSRRGGQLARRVAAILDEPVRYRDPMTDATTLVHPPRSGAGPATAAVAWSRRSAAVDPTPWGTGLTVAAFIAAFVVVAMLALASALATETAGWVAVVAAAVVTGGLAPSLWLGRRVPVVRWVVLGAVAGTILSWFGVLFIAFG